MIHRNKFKANDLGELLWKVFTVLWKVGKCSRNIYKKLCHSPKYHLITYHVQSMFLIWIWLVLWFCLSWIHKFTSVLWLYDRYNNKKFILCASVNSWTPRFLSFIPLKGAHLLFLVLKILLQEKTIKGRWKWGKRIFEISGLHFNHLL